ncbi:MAG: ATP-dependent nuclease subunit B-like protein [Bryobacterales bacterium]|nr:ATP-dependent nuclease subunit B-like protein [Bryobacterales bacterium]
MRIVRGAPGTGKTALVFREFKAAQAEGRDPRIVVPTATLVRHFQHELARDGVVCRPRSVISMARLAAELAGEVKLAPPALVRAMVREALKSLDLPAFAEAAKTEGMAAVVEETISLFEGAGCGPERLAEARGLSARAKAFARVWKAVAQDLGAAGYAGRLEMFRSAIANVRPMTLWFDGFLHFSPVEIQLVEALDDLGRVVVTGGESGDEATLFDERTGGAPRRPRMVAVAVDSLEREADEMARRIMELHAAGTPFREIGVAVREAGVYEPVLRGVFERYGIPARFYFSSPLQGHPAATFLSGLIDCALRGWDHREALEALRADPRWGLTAAFDRFDFAVRERLPDRGAAELQKQAEDGYGRRVADCTAIRHWPEELLPAKDWARRLEQFAAKLYVPGRIDAPLTFADVEMLRSQTAGLRAWTDAVTEVTDLWPESRGALSLAEYWAVARMAVRESSYRVPDDRRDVVHVLSSYEARQWDVTALFVCGATNRDYPRRSSQNLLFPDAEIDALRKSGIPLRRSSDVELEEDDLWRELRCRARSELIVTWPRHDAGGRSVEASRYLGEADLEERAVLTIAAGGETNRRGSRGRIADPELLRELAGQHQEASVTALEDLAQCQFKFFAGRTLKLRTAPERPEQRLQPKVSGLIMHEALEKWLQVNRQADFVALYEAAFEEMRRKLHLPAGFKLEVERAFLRGVAEKVSTTELWTAQKTQAEVDFAFALTPEFTVKGRMDRIDWMNDSDCVIIDYKGGRSKRVEGFLHNPAKLQGPLYALAAREMGLRTIAMMYIAVRDDKRYGWGSVPGADLDLIPMPAGWLDDARDVAVKRVEQLLAGMIEARPTEAADCRFCDHRDACHVKEDQRELVRIAGAISA